MKPNPDLTFVREPEVNPEHIAAVGKQQHSRNTPARALPPDRLWCIIYKFEQEYHKDFVWDEMTLQMKVGQMTSSFKFSPVNTADEGPKREFISAWQMMEGCWIELEVKLDLSLKAHDKWVADDPEEDE